MPEAAFDVCVTGTGAGGGVMIDQLAAAGFRVVAVRVHTLIAFLAHPKYSGNRDYAGWRVTHYPGPRHHQGGYTPEQVAAPAKVKTIWGSEQ